MPTMSTTLTSDLANHVDHADHGNDADHADHADLYILKKPGKSAMKYLSPGHTDWHEQVLNQDDVKHYHGARNDLVTCVV